MTTTTSIYQDLPQQRLPFTIRRVDDPSSLDKAVAMRQRAYARHVPEFAATLGQPENADYEPGSLVLLAESRLDGEALGTMRIQTNAAGPLKLEQSLVLPDWLQGLHLAEATRLGVAHEAIGRMVKTALFKAYFLHCLAEGIDWLVITARKPLDRIYEALLFRDVVPGGAPVPMRHVGNIPHRVMAFSVADAEQRWAACRHPLYDFMVRTAHPDIHVGALGHEGCFVLPARAEKHAGMNA